MEKRTRPWAETHLCIAKQYIYPFGDTKNVTRREAKSTCAEHEDKVSHHGEKKSTWGETYLCVAKQLVIPDTHPKIWCDNITTLFITLMRP
jgi:hypothetical protein